MAVQKQNISRTMTNDDVALARAVKNPMSLTRFPICWRTPNEGLVWAPLVEMYSRDDKFIVHVEVPGVNKDDLRVAVIGNDLIIKGERKTETTIEKRDYYCSEISQGKFFRTVSLPIEARKTKIKATYNDGILEVELPRDTSGKSNQMDIKVNSARPKKVSTGKL